MCKCANGPDYDPTSLMCDERYRECEFVISSVFDAILAEALAAPMKFPDHETEQALDCALDLASVVRREHAKALEKLTAEFQLHADERCFADWQPYLRRIVRDGIWAIRRS